MVKELMQFLNYGRLAEIALVIFALVFVAVVVRTLLMRRELTEAQSQVVLNEGHPVAEDRKMAAEHPPNGDEEVRS